MNDRTWWHYTCIHGRKRIGDAGVLYPLSDLVDAGRVKLIPVGARPLAHLVWLTDLDVPYREALGLTMRILGCDRTRHRYRALPAPGDILTPTRYVDMRRTLPPEAREQIESAPGALPAHWWISYEPVAVVLDDPPGGTS